MAHYSFNFDIIKNHVVNYCSSAKSQLCQIGSQLMIHTIPIFNRLSNAPFLGNPLLGQEMITRMGDIHHTSSWK
jgi:hypothetical protein